ncbi:ankyrin repeat and protein kinase domain-containing protein 1 [Brienomyrus brachyistius]|uniref:ankyrin repeat and protein kinase domain-containing protein 1 n=1 Tax=Brienomyrus brachyistius TaxID=42636 RepID=UPI0020B28F0E|nr:ankyrin repeat and protein kinase domain-containing protein 1 [Brienomyrus brachyistius]
MEPTDHRELERLQHFQPDDFEADWTKVADGTLGRVYKVKLKLWRETFAMKQSSNSTSSNRICRRMVEEASKMEKVKFSHIVSIYGVCSDPPAVVMEFMSNGSLNTLLHSHVLMWPKKFQMIHEVTMGMNYLHSMKPELLHLNLKPSNVLLDDHLHAKISDFGLVKWEDFSSSMDFIEHMSMRGNTCYIPPEIFTQSPEAPGPQYDVYSFAIVIWEILTQKKPYPGVGNMMPVIMKVTSGKRPSVEVIPEDKPQECEEMIDIMRCCWKQEVADRPPFSAIVRDTESLSEVLKISDVIRACGESQKTHRRTSVILSIFNRETKPESTSAAGTADGADDVAGLLLRKDLERFKSVLQKEQVSAVYTGGNSLLHYAAASGDAASVRLVLELGAAVDTRSEQSYTPLIIAVLHKSLDVCSVLLDCGADPNLSDADGWTALHFVAQNGDDRTARLLLDRGAAPDPAEKEGWTPLHLAAQNGHESMVRLLLPRVASADRATGNGRTALHLAARYGHMGITRLLLGQGADPNRRDGPQGSALYLAADGGHFRVARLLIGAGADVNLTDSRCFSALHLAALKGHTGICRLLLGNGAHANARTSQGWTPLHLAALKGHPVPIPLLEEHGASLDAQGDSDRTALHLACCYSHEEVVAALLTAGANPNLLDKRGWSPLHLASSGGSFPCVLQLLSHQAHVNAQNASQATALHLASAVGNVPIVQALLLNGARRDMRDAKGYTPKELAHSNQKEEVIQLLEE